MPDSQSREPWFECPLLPFRSLLIFVLSMTPQLTQLCKLVPGYRQWWKCESIVFAPNCSMARMLPREVKLVSEWTGLGVKCNAVSGPTNWILRYIKHTFIMSNSHGFLCCRGDPRGAVLCGVPYRASYPEFHSRREPH